MSDATIDRLVGLPFFSEADYRDLNPDVARAGIPAAEHALRYALAEGRPMFRRERLASAWGEAITATGRGAPAVPPDSVARTRETSDGVTAVTIRVSSRSDPAEVALAASLAEALAASAFGVTLVDETADPSGEAEFSIVVAPHVFFDEGLGRVWSGDALVERSLMFNTVPIHSLELRRALPYLLRGRGVLDASAQVAHMFGGAGMSAFHVRLASPIRERWLVDGDDDDPLVRAMPAAGRGAAFDAAAWEGRPLDLSFFCRHSTRRSAILRRHAETFAARPCFLYMAHRSPDPLEEAVAGRRSFRIAGHVSARSRITLLLAEDEFPHFDWQRCIAHAMASGSVVVSDTGCPHPDFQAGTHLFQDDLRHLADLSRWLLDEPDGRQAARDARARAFDVLNRSAAVLASDLRAFLSTLPG